MPDHHATGPCSAECPVCALFARASGGCEGSADVLDPYALAFRCGTHEHDHCVEPMSPKVIDGPPTCVLGLGAGGIHDRSLHAVAALRMADVAAGGVLGQHPLRETVDIEPVRPTRSARQVRIGCKLHERRSWIRRAFSMTRAKYVGDVLDRSTYDQRVQHNRPDLFITRSTLCDHAAKVRYIEHADRYALRRAHIPGNLRYGVMLDAPFVVGANVMLMCESATRSEVVDMTTSGAADNSWVSSVSWSMRAWSHVSLVESWG